MPSGVYLSKRERELVFFYHVELGIAPDDIFFLLFHGENERITLKYLRSLCTKLRYSADYAEYYVSGPYERHVGHEFKVTDFARDYLLDLVADNPCCKISAYRDNLCHHFYENVADYPSNVTVFRALRRSNYSRKIVSQVHVRRDYQRRLQYLEFIAFLPPRLLVNVDETASNPHDFEQKRGWAPVGDDCYHEQIIIGSETYSVIAAYTEYGFIAWRIYDVCITGDIFANFVDVYLAPMLAEDNVVLLDNASVHKTVGALASLIDATHDRYCFLPQYSPDFAPIERGLSNVKAWLKENEREAINSPIEMIHAAFELYSVWGLRSHTAYNHWNGYRANHDTFLNE